MFGLFVHSRQTLTPITFPEEGQVPSSKDVTYYRLGHETGLRSELALTPLRSIERQKSKGSEESRAIEAACNVWSIP